MPGLQREDIHIYHMAEPADQLENNNHNNMSGNARGVGGGAEGAVRYNVIEYNDHMNIPPRSSFNQNGRRRSTINHQRCASVSPINVTQFINAHILNIINLWKTGMASTHEILDDLGIILIIKDHPFLALLLIGIYLVVGLPFIIFLLFSIITLMLSFIGFLLVEGALISFAATIVFLFIGTSLVTVTIALFTVFTTYFTISYLWNLFVQSMRSAKLMIRNNRFVGMGLFMLKLN